MPRRSFHFQRLRPAQKLLTRNIYHFDLFVDKSEVVDTKENLIADNPFPKNKPLPANSSPGKAALEHHKITLRLRNFTFERRKNTLRLRNFTLERRKSTFERRKITLEHRKTTLERRKCLSGHRKTTLELGKKTSEHQ